MSVVSFFKENWYVFLISIIAMLATFLMVEDYKQLPSPLYGGDFWNHLGIIRHMFYGGSFFDSAELLGETPWVPWFYHLYNLVLAKITGWDPMIADINNSIFLVPISAFLMWYLATRFTENKLIVSASIILLLAKFPFFKYTDFAFMVIAPLLMATWFFYIKKPDSIRQIALALVMGLCSLTNTQLFFASYIFFGVIVIDRIYSYAKSGKKFGFNQDTIAEFKPFLVIFVVSFLISLIYWYWPIFVYRVHTPNDLQIYGWADFSKIDLQFSYPLGRLFDTFVGNGNPVQLVWRLASLAGAVLVFQRRNDPKYYFAFLILVAAFIGLFHHLITFNLFHIQLAPERIFEMYMISFGFVLFAIAADEAIQRFKNIGSYIPYAAILIALLAFNSNFSFWTNPAEGSFQLGGKEPMRPEFLKLQGWIINNTNVNDVFLTDNEDAFMMNALTGRKSVSYRRTHTSTYADMDQRNLDSAVMLYSPNDKMRSDLLKKYKVKYLLFTGQWFSNQVLVKDGQVQRMYDPFMSKDRPDYRSYLDSNSVQFITLHYYLDPAFVENYPMYDVIVVPPQGMEEMKPWSEGFNSRLKELYRINIEGAPPDYPPFAVIYGVSDD